MGLTLQIWDRNGAYGYWTVALDCPTTATSSFDNSLLQDSVPRLRRLEELHHNELERAAERHKATATSTGSLDMAVNTNWMRRTGWNETFAGANRKLLVELVQMPRGRGQRINLGTYDDTVLCSCEEDERKLALIVSALDRVFDRCEDTVRHTDVSIRCWLRGQYFDRPYKAPFELVGRKATTGRYRRLLVKCICFCVRLWRLDEGARERLLGRPLTRTQRQFLAQLWSNDVWSLLPAAQAEGARSPVTKPNPTFSCDSDSEIEDEAEEDNDCASVTTSGSDEGEAQLDRDGRGHGTNARVSDQIVRLPSPVGTMKGTVESTLEDLVLQFGYFQATEEYEDGKPSSTLLIYFTGILGISPDGSTYERAKNYTTKLSGLIYRIRLLVVEATLPRFAHDYIGWGARPRHGQLGLLNKVREKLCLGSQAPMGELLSLRNYGRVISRSDGPSFRVTWSEDGQTIFWDDFHLSIAQFRQISRDAITSAASTCNQLMYGWCPTFDLKVIRDKLSDTTAGYSFVMDPANGLSEAYLELSRRACLATINGLMTDDAWDMTAVRRYLDWYHHMTELVMHLFYLVGGQAPRGTELAALEHCNGSSTSRGVCVYSGKMGLICRHTKSRRATNSEFHVVRFLPREPGRILYYYLAFIQPFACMLYRVCFSLDIDSTLLFSSPTSPEEPWKTYTLTRALSR